MSATEIECIVPFAVSGLSTTTMQVTYNGAKSNPVQIPTIGSAAEVLAVINGDFTLNSATNPASPGSIITVYITGAGQTVPNSTDGVVYTNPLPLPLHAVTAQTGAALLAVTYAAAAYGLAGGIWQVNLQAPAQSTRSVAVATGMSFAYFDVVVQ